MVLRWDLVDGCLQLRLRMFRQSRFGSGGTSCLVDFWLVACPPQQGRGNLGVLILRMLVGC